MWAPIGRAARSYTGHFDGQSHTISGLKLNADTSGDWGLFGYVSGATIENFSVSGSVESTLTSKTSSEQFDYGVIGEANNGTVVTNVHSSVNFTSNDTFMKNTIGGIVGKTNNAGTGITIDRCSFSGAFDMGNTDVDCLGGIIAYVMADHTANITNCAFYGSFTSTYAESDQMGGIMGYYRGSNLTIKNCLSVGSITTINNMVNGAIIGVLRQHGSANSKVNNNYYLTGNPFGDSTANDDITNSYGSQTASKSATATTGEELANGTIATLLGNAWEQGELYPILKK